MTFLNLSEFICQETSADNLEVQFFGLHCVRLPFTFPKKSKKLSFEENLKSPNIPPPAHCAPSVRPSVSNTQISETAYCIRFF